MSLILKIPGINIFFPEAVHIDINFLALFTQNFAVEFFSFLSLPWQSPGKTS